MHIYISHKSFGFLHQSFQRTLTLFDINDGCTIESSPSSGDSCDNTQLGGVVPIPRDEIAIVANGLCPCIDHLYGSLCHVRSHHHQQQQQQQQQHYDDPRRGSPVTHEGNEFVVVFSIDGIHGGTERKRYYFVASAESERWYHRSIEILMSHSSSAYYYCWRNYYFHFDCRPIHLVDGFDTATARVGPGHEHQSIPALFQRDSDEWRINIIIIIAIRDTTSITLWYHRTPSESYR